MARRKGSPRLSPEELERMRNDPGRVISDTFRPSPSNPSRPGRPGGVLYDRIGDMRIPEKGEFFGYTQPGGGPDDFGRPAVGYDRPDRDRKLDEYRELLGQLEESRGKTRKGRDSSKSRSYDQRKADADRRQAEYKDNQDRYRGDFTHGGGITQQVVVPWYNPETGARWSAPNPGYEPKEGTGWVKGYGPNNDAVSNKPVASTKETSNKSSKFEAMLRARMGKF